MKDKYKIENQWQLYLERADTNESKMHVTQLSETKKAFFGAAGQMLLLLRDDVTEETDAESVFVLDGMLNEIDDFWTMELKKYEQNG